MNHRELFDLVVNLQSVLPNTRENSRARSLADALRRTLGVIEEPFTYTSQVLALAPAATNQDQINIQADSDFKILAGAYIADDSQGPYTIPALAEVSVLLTDTGSGRNLMDEAVPIPSIFGTGQLPFIWPVPKLMSARSTLQVQYTNISAAQTYAYIRLAFIGVKLYPLG